MGTSLEKLQRNYWNKSQSITPEMAAEYFAIMPDAKANIVKLAVNE